MIDSMREDSLHWADDDLLRRLYGLAPDSAASDQHLASCVKCSGRWEALLLARAETLNEAGVCVVAEDRIAEQRKALWARIDHPGRFWLSRWAPVAATTVMLVAGLVLLHPARPLPASDAQAGYRSASGSAPASISDAQLFSDLSAMAAPGPSRAVEPIRGLFENSSSEEEGSF